VKDEQIRTELSEMLECQPDSPLEMAFDDRRDELHVLALPAIDCPRRGSRLPRDRYGLFESSGVCCCGSLGDLDGRSLQQRRQLFSRAGGSAQEQVQTFLVGVGIGVRRGGRGRREGLGHMAMMSNGADQFLTDR
jgi:hypothetical protein